MPAPSRLLALVCAALLLPGCAPQEEPAPDPHDALIGTWEIIGDAGSLNRNGQRYVFGPDGALYINRPRPLGPTVTINAAYDFVDDSTLQIRSEFDAENLLPRLSGDTLTLRPTGTGDALTLIRISDATPVPTPAPLDTVVDSVYSPPSDAPLDEMPRTQSR